MYKSPYFSAIWFFFGTVLFRQNWCTIYPFILRHINFDRLYGKTVVDCRNRIERIFNVIKHFPHKLIWAKHPWGWHANSSHALWYTVKRNCKYRIYDNLVNKHNISHCLINPFGGLNFDLHCMPTSLVAEQ